MIQIQNVIDVNLDMNKNKCEFFLINFPKATNFKLEKKNKSKKEKNKNKFQNLS